MLKKNSKIFIAGHRGLVGGAILRKLNKNGYKNIITIPKKKLDLRDQSKVFKFLKKNKPDFIINAAASVGGIVANNNFKANFIYDNISIQNNIIHGAFLNKIKNLIFLGSSCVYPKHCKQPIKESYLLTGALEPTNEPYSVAKIAGIKMCESYNYQYKTNYICLMPCNTYGPNDNYDLITCHFLPAIIRKLFEASKSNVKQIKLWGTGNAKRELIYVDDIADACFFFMKKKIKHSLINVGTQKDNTIKEYAELILKKIGKKIKITFDNNKKMDGTSRKLLDCSLAKKYGWRSKISVDRGLDLTIEDYLKQNNNNIREVKF